MGKDRKADGMKGWGRRERNTFPTIKELSERVFMALF